MRQILSFPQNITSIITDFFDFFNKKTEKFKKTLAEVLSFVYNRGSDDKMQQKPRRLRKERIALFYGERKTEPNRDSEEKTPPLGRSLGWT
jgi:hypothetical protein